MDMDDKEEIHLESLMENVSHNKSQKGNISDRNKQTCYQICSIKSQRTWTFLKKHPKSVISIFIIAVIISTVIITVISIKLSRTKYGGNQEEKANGTFPRQTNTIAFNSSINKINIPYESKGFKLDVNVTLNEPTRVYVNVKVNDEKKPYLNHMVRCNKLLCSITMPDERKLVSGDNMTITIKPVEKIVSTKGILSLSPLLENKCQKVTGCL